MAKNSFDDEVARYLNGNKFKQRLADLVEEAVSLRDMEEQEFRRNLPDYIRNIIDEHDAKRVPIVSQTKKKDEIAHLTSEDFLTLLSKVCPDAIYSQLIQEVAGRVLGPFRQVKFNFPFAKT
jgi:regulator of replication initiation timing